MEKKRKNLLQHMLEKAAVSCADSASLVCAYEPDLPMCLKEEKEEKQIAGKDF